MTVEPEHVYYANGILVSNCNAALGAVLMASVLGGRRPQPKPEEEMPHDIIELRERQRDAALAKERERAMHGGKFEATPRGRTMYYRRPRW